MARSIFTHIKETPRTVSAGILDALGRGFLIATASFVAGTMFGTASLAVGLWTIGVIAASGIACMVGSALVKNAGCPRYTRKWGGSPRAANVATVATATPTVEAAEEVAAEDWRARRRVMDGRRREHGTGRGV